MRLVKRNDIGQAYTTVAAIPAGDAKLLRAKWRGESVDLAHVGNLIKEYADKDAWVACDCLDQVEGAARNPPILTPVQKDGVYHLRRNAKRAEHTDQCPFKWEEGELGGEGGGSRSGGGLKRPVDFLLYTREDAIASDGHGTLGNRSPSAPRRNALQERMFTLLEDAGLNVQNGEPTGNTWGELQRVANRIKLVGDFRLSDVLWSRPDALTSFWARTKFHQIAKADEWPANVPVQGFVLTSATAVEGKTITFGTVGSIEVETPVSIYSGAQRATGPFLVLVSLKYDRKTDAVKAYRAYAHPRFFERGGHEWSYTPVDSDYERKALGALLWVAKKGREHDIDLLVEKPLFDLEPEVGGPTCRPDFLIRYGDRRIVVETMGSDEDEYLDRKTRTHATMEKIGKVILDNRVGVDPKLANRILIRQVIEELRSLGAPWPASA